MVGYMKETLKMVIIMALEYTLGQVAKDTKGSGKTTSNMAKEYTLG